MTDRELLERAARAAGIKLIWSSEPGWAPKIKGRRMQSWNPLDDDGDALRLAAALRINLIFDRDVSVTAIHGDRENSALEMIQDDAALATRRAIVRVAALLVPK